MQGLQRLTLFFARLRARGEGSQGGLTGSRGFFRHDTTASLIANSILLLLDPLHAGQRAQLEADLRAGPAQRSEWTDAVLEELMRHISPIKEMVRQVQLTGGERQTTILPMGRPVSERRQRMLLSSESETGGRGWREGGREVKQPDALALTVLQAGAGSRGRRWWGRVGR